MSKDRKRLYAVSYAAFVLLFLALFIPTENSAPLAALVTLLTSGLAVYFVRKREIYSYMKSQVTAVMAALGFLYVAVYYLSILAFGYTYSPTRLTADSFFVSVIPIAATIFFSEILRAVLLASHNRQASVLGYLSCVVAQVLAFKTIPQITTLGVFMDVMAVTFLPALLENLLYHYLSRRYGIFPNVVYRLFIGLFAYIIPVISAVPDAVYSTVKLFAPLLIYLYIDGVFEKKRRLALAKKQVASYAVTALVLVAVVLVGMLVSCRFRFGALVVGSGSMTGEIDKGDVIVYEAYEDAAEEVQKGGVIVFEKNKSTIIHRVVGIEIINNQTRYITKGDANEENDTGYITDGQIIGLVKWKAPGIGYPTIWLRELFKS